MKAFSAARIKLTLWYMFISYSLLALFTAAVISAERQAFAQVIDLVHSHVRGIVFNVYLQQQIEDFEANFSRWLLLFDSVILIIATAASYFLSGRTLAPIEKVMQEQERFTADMSHELRTPLASMAMELEAYQRSRQSRSETAELVSSLQAEIKRMSGMVSGLMRLARLDQAKAEQISKRDDQLVDMRQVVESGLAIVEPLAIERRLRIDSTMSPVGEVLGSPDELLQMVLILLDNAVKYSSGGGIIRIRLSGQKDQIKLTVFNSGSGISAKDLPLVFNRFYRGQNAGDEGSGLGLAIARHIVELYGGSIAAASQSGKGATFRVLLPIAKHRLR